ncbi:hypothetical protein PENSPDRAFT_751453 [Peniophora sp. CONT]|nr:hypothetical protein PENSPDRAFT_751453 [Peniophora sp. CONT]
MHRFRKWSDPRKSAVPENIRSNSASNQPPEVPALPPPSDFRTSLILPDLSRRFSLLRTSTGDFLPLDDLRSKFAEQRARGSENAISKEEEDMLLATLGRLRQKSSVNSTASSSFSTGGGGESGYQSSQSNSVRSSEITVSSSTGSTSSFTARANRRRSNNLFGSGRFADESYLRQAQRERKGGSGQSSVLAGSVSSATSSTYRNTDTDAGTAPVAVEGAALERTLSKLLPRNQLHRASMALDEVIREIEEEAEDGEDEGDDKVLVPRSPIDARTTATATAYSADHPVENRSTPSPYPRSSDASPTPRLPGYIPGMPRPMTPRDWEDGAYDSATPRATSPQNGPLGSLRRDTTTAARASSPLTLSAFMPLSVNSDTEMGYSTSGGRQTPDATVRPRGHARNDSSGQNSFAAGSSPAEPDDSFMDFGTPPDASILGDRMRPKSPFAGGSRPSTPSNITWRTPGSPSSSFGLGHSRNGSTASDVSANAAAVYGRRRSGSVPSYSYNNEPVERTTSPLGARSLRSPPLPDSPTGGAAFASFVAPDPRRPPSVNSGLELGSPAALVHRQLRSPTPTNATGPVQPAPIRPRSPASPVGRSPASPVYSDFGFGIDRSNNNSRADSRNGHYAQPIDRSTNTSRASQYAYRSGATSPFALAQSHALLLSPIGNSSRESFESTGSSYHSVEKGERGGVLGLLDVGQPQWHDLESSSSASTSSGLGLGFGSLTTTKANSNSDTGMSAEKAEEYIQRYAGLTKLEFKAVQEMLIGNANRKDEASDLQRERRDSLKRRRRSLSTGQREAPKFAEPAQEPLRVMSPIDPRANALLESLVDDNRPARVPEPPTISVTLPITQQRSISPSPSLASSPSLKRRRAALADALFGGTEFDDSRDVVSPLQPSPSILPRSLEVQRSASRSPDVERRDVRSPDAQYSVAASSVEPVLEARTALPSQPEQPSSEQSPVFARHERPSSPATPQRSERTLRSPIAAQHERDMLGSPTGPTSPLAQHYGSVSSSTSTPALPLGNPTELALEVQRRADFAMAMINKSPSSPHLPEQTHATPKKRVDVNQISGPQLKWASTSVETIPISHAQNATPPSPVPASASASASMSAATGSKLGGRFKKLRGTLRAKPAVPMGEEVSPYTLMTPMSATASPSAQSLTYSPAHLAPSGPSVPQSARAADFNERQDYYSVTTPPASAGPGLKGFMSRFRKKSLHESAESESLNARAAVQYGSGAVGRAGGTPTPLSSGRPTQVQMSVSQEVHSAPAHKPAFSTDSGSALSSAPRRSSSMRVPGRGSSEASLSRSATMRAAVTTPHGRATPSPIAEDEYSSREQVEEQQPNNDQAALRQLFDAASNLGLDQDALSDLLSRSTSLSTKRSTAASKPPKHASNAPSLAPSWVDPSRATSPFAISVRATSPDSTGGRPSLDQTVRMPLQQAAKPEQPAQNLAFRKQAVRKSATPTEASRRSTVVRRTIILPSDLQSLRELRQSTFGGSGSPQPPLPSRKGSTRSRRRSAGAASVLSPSVQDRVPTPPPPKSPTGMRFSTDSSPPLPQMPSLTQYADSSNFLAPPGSIEKSNSTYDSLYDMYTSDSKPTILTVDTDADTSAGSLGLDALNNLEPGSAVEVLEMANGETVWSIVNGLRDSEALDAEESFYGNRASFMSEYSMRDDEGVQVYFKEHGRKGSKESASSFLSRRKSQQEPSKRPETKVFYSSSAQIGRLIENLSSGLGVDSGSFNIVPGAGAAPRSYHSESSANWTVEERIERMLASNSNY